jgi:hypothetical protein
MKSAIFWEVTSCSLVEIHQQFGEMYCSHIEQSSSTLKMESTFFFKYGLTFNELEGLISQKTAVRTSDPNLKYFAYNSFLVRTQISIRSRNIYLTACER